MKAREYLETLGKNNKVAFIIQFKASVTEHTEQILYRETPIWQQWEWMQSTSGILDYEVVAEDVTPLSPVWKTMFKNNDSFKCVLITEDYDMIYKAEYKKPIHKIVYGK